MKAPLPTSSEQFAPASNDAAYEGRWWHHENGRVACDLCPRACKIPDGKRGFCFVRQNVGGKMLLTTYGKSTGFCIDPIEKKPLNHFLPGTPVLSFGTAGCNLGCKFCQNWDISKAKQIEILSDFASPEAIAEAAVAYECKSIAFTYNDPVIWAEYAIDAARAARNRGIKTVAVTAGYITPQARGEFYEYIDAANVDLKAFSELFYENVTLSALEPVLDTLKWLKHESNVWFEITNLMIPGKNDSPDEISKMCDWIMNAIGDSVPIHFTAFHPDYKMMDIPATPPETLRRAREQAIRAGIKYAYIGNCHDVQGQSTYCPSCREVLIERDWYQLGAYNIENGRCNKCQKPIAGVFDGPKGEWGPKRMPIVINSDGADEQSKRARFELAQKTRANKAAEVARPRGANISAPAGDVRSVELNFKPRTEFGPEDIEELLEFTSHVAETALAGKSTFKALPAELVDAPAYGLFVTFKRGSLLRACRGRWGSEEQQSLGELVLDVTRETVRMDPRFPAITLAEYPLLSTELSVMHSPQMLPTAAQERLASVKIGTHGLVIFHAQGRGLLLPQVASEHGLSAEQFLEQVCEKAGLPRDAWTRPDTEILSFQARHFSRQPAAPELDMTMLPDGIMQDLLRIANLIYEGAQGEVRIQRILGYTFAGELGMQMRLATGETAVSFAPKTSLLTLTQQLVQSLKGARPQVPAPAIAEVTVLTQPVSVGVEDFPNRIQLFSSHAFVAKKAQAVALQLPSGEQAVKLAVTALGRVGATKEDWTNGRTALLNFRVRTVSAARVSSAQIIRPQGEEPDVRKAAFAGRFYPADAVEMEKEIEAALKLPKRGKKKTPAAIMLPHAGWKYCGHIMGDALRTVEVPQSVVVIGPKHTRNGARFSLASHALWETPGKKVKIDARLIAALKNSLPGFEIESEAHREEHSCEVLLPFLKFLNPEVLIAPIAVGPCSFEEAQALASGLAAVIKNATPRPLIVISSDMNHFAPDKENRRLDKLALAAMEKADPKKLYDTCQTHEISMCGLMPAVITMLALKELGKKLKVEVISYDTSAKASKDKSSVVGYAGAHLSI